MSKHTEGPWFADGVRFVRQLNGQRNVICRLPTQFKPADQSLIAAAPELLDALIGILDAAENFYIEGAVNPDKCKDIQAARAAIAKANGETQ